MYSVAARLVERIVSGAKGVITTFVAIVNRKVLLMMCVRIGEAGRVDGVVIAISGSDRMQAGRDPGAPRNIFS